VQLDWRLEAMSRVLDRKLAQPAGFSKDAAVTTRVYTGDGSRCLPLRYAIASVTGLVVKRDTDNDGSFADETALTLNTDFELRPLDADQGPEARPWTELYIPDWAATYYSWYERYRVQVVAIHGWPAIPQAIKLATIELTAMVAGDSTFTTNRINELDQAVDASPQARAILRDLWQVYNFYPIAVG